jgi:hypothetical protein
MYIGCGSFGLELVGDFCGDIGDVVEQANFVLFDVGDVAA